MDQTQVKQTYEVFSKNVVIEKEKRNRWYNEKYAEFRINIESDKIDKLKNKFLGVKQMVKGKSDINSLADVLYKNYFCN